MKLSARNQLSGTVTNVDDVDRAMAGADGCFHLAAVASVVRCNERWAETHRTNLTGTIRVLERAADGDLDQRRLERRGERVPLAVPAAPGELDRCVFRSRLIVASTSFRPVVSGTTGTS